MLARFAARLADLAQRCVPDPFVIALGLSFGALALAWTVMPAPDLGVLAQGWYARFTAAGTLAFTTQMALILVMGAALARAPLVARALSALAGRPRSTASAAALTAVVAMCAGLLNWGFGLVAGALLAREIGERARAEGRAINYPLIGAAGYTGMLIWHGGFSGSAPLKVTEGGPAGAPPIGLDATLFSPLNLGVTLGLLLFVPFLLTRMCDPRRDAVPQALPARAPLDEHVESRPWLGALLVLGVLALGGVALTQQVGGVESWWRAVDLGSVILMLALLGLALHGSPLRYARAFGEAAPEAGGILLQFPFYFGILGLLEAGGLVAWFAAHSADLARGLSALGLPLGLAFDGVTFVSAGLVNLFVPSGGGQWAVQGSIVAEACRELGLPLPRAVMALSYGDEWTNMLQPFWALALLGLTGLKARDILGYTLTLMLGALLVYFTAFALL